MKFTHFINISLSLALLVPIFGRSEEFVPRKRRPGHILFKLKSDLNENQRISLQSFFNAKKLKSKKKIGQFMYLAESTQLISVKSLSEEQIAKNLMNSGAVEYAEPDYLLDPTASELTEPNDPYFSKQWHHQTIQTVEAWQVTQGQPNITVAVCDSGVDANHPDLKGNVIQPGYNVVDHSTTSGPITSHGTYVAGLIVAHANNRVGIAGIAPRVKVLPIRVTNTKDGKAYLSDLAECIQYGADQGAKVINLSFSGAENRSIDTAAQYARSKGSLLFMSAGNNGKALLSSANYSSFILVGATTSQNQLSSFSNYGTPVDLVAPGSSVLTTIPGNAYAYVSGTSFSAPITAAVGALVFSVNPKFSPEDVENILFESADAIGNDYYFGHGLINAAQAVDLAKRWE